YDGIGRRSFRKSLRSRTIERRDAYFMFEWQVERKAESKVRPIGRRKKHAVKDLVLRVRAFHYAARLFDIAAKKHQGSRGKFWHLDRIEANVKWIAHVRFPCGIDLRFKGVPDDCVPVLQCAVGGEDRDAFAVVIV